MDDSATLRKTLRAELAARLPDPPDPALWQRLPGGRSNLCWLVPDTALDAHWPERGDLVLKLFRKQAASALFPNSPLAELSCLAALAPYSLAPRVLAAWNGDRGHCLAYRHLPGPLWSREGGSAGRLLRHLHGLQVPITLSGLRPMPCDAETLVAQVRTMASALPAEMATLLTDRLATLPGGGLSADPAEPDPGPPCLLHGDPVASNIVMTDLGPRLIDWQCPALGDPVHDLSVFLSPAMAHLYLGRQLSPQERRDFLAAYDAPQVTARLIARAPLLHLRMAAHCLARAAKGSAEDAEAARLELSAIDRAAA